MVPSPDGVKLPEAQVSKALLNVYIELGAIRLAIRKPSGSTSPLSCWREAGKANIAVPAAWFQSSTELTTQSANRSAQALGLNGEEMTHLCGQISNAQGFIPGSTCCGRHSLQSSAMLIGAVLKPTKPFVRVISRDDRLRSGPSSAAG